MSIIGFDQSVFDQLGVRVQGWGLLANGSNGILCAAQCRVVLTASSTSEDLGHNGSNVIPRRARPGLVGLGPQTTGGARP